MTHKCVKKKPSIKLLREEVKAIFRAHDINGDGHLSIKELSRAFGSLGALLPLYRAVCGILAADADGDGLITDEELEKVVDYAVKCKYDII
ncbi:calmodulin-like protein 5 [Momordica charantia]|uniref:Calmodulin-like protein 5 n=1 Tax=Momordica charantia TaxID=3673 RepID=A0A6J1CS20_MOMCH|nr:calmodulin-like protein 5 [Momordica charantia]